VVTPANFSRVLPSPSGVRGREEWLDGPDERRQVRLDHFPYSVKINSVVLVDQDVSQAHFTSPGRDGVLIAKNLREPTDCFTMTMNWYSTADEMASSARNAARSRPAVYFKILCAAA
jgi:hypothetical protein